MISLFNNIFQITLLSSILIVAVLLTRKLFSKKIHIKVLILLWTMVLVRLIVPFSYETSVHIGEIIPTLNPSFITPENIASTEGDTIDNTINSDATIPTEIKMQNDTTVDTVNSEYIEPTSENVDSYLSQINIMQLFAYIWLIGAILSLIIKLKKMYIFSKKISKSIEVQNDKILLILKNNKSLIKLKRDTKIYECHCIDAPLTCGVFRPKILIPVGFISSLNENQQNMIILHELYHIKNLDVLKNYLWLAAKIVYWFNPLISLAYKAYIEDTELCCDTMVLDTYSSDQRQQYSQSLINITKLSKGEMILPVALSFCEDKSTLRKRVEYMIKPTKKLKTVSILSLLIALIFAMLCFTTACLPKASENVITFLEETIHIDYEIEPAKNVQLTINADAAYPAYDSVPIEGIKPVNITSEQLQILADYVLGDTPLYYNNEYPNYIDAEHDSADLFDGTIVPLDENNRTSTNLYTTTSSGHKSILELEQQYNEHNSLLTYWRDHDSSNRENFYVYERSVMDNMNKTHDEYLQIAKDLIEELLGENNVYEVYDTYTFTNQNSNPAFDFFFFPSYYDIESIKYIRPIYDGGLKYSNLFGHESIHVSVDDEGINLVNWFCPTVSIGTVEENADLLAFEDIMESFDEYCKKKNDWIPVNFRKEYEVISTDIYITSVELSFMPIAEYQDNSIVLPYKLTPVWSFIGDITMYTQELDEGYGTNPIVLNDMCVASVNAIDGTVFE